MSNPNLPPSLRLKHLWPIADQLEDARRRQLRSGGLIRPKLHEAQQRIKAAAARFNVAACGRRFGKSILGEDIACDYLLAGWPVGWFAPSYKILADSWRDIQRVLSPLAVDSSTTEHRIALSTKGVLECWSLDNPDAGRSRKYKCVIIDEAAMVRYLGDAWQASIRPTLTDYQGDAWFLSTPRGSNFFRTIYNWGQDELRPDWRSWQMPSLSNTTLVDLDKEVEAARLELPERVFRQEYLAEFIDDAGGVFRRVLDAASIPCVSGTPALAGEVGSDGVLRPRPIAPDHSYLIGCDWGKYNDFTVLAVIDTTTKELVALDRFNQIDYVVQIERLRTLAAKFKTKTLVPEHNAIGIPLIEQLQREGYNVHPFTTTNASKAEAIDGLALAIEKGDLHIIDHPTLIAELQAYEAERLPSGMLRYSSPEGYHDDCVVALALAWHGASIRPRRVLYA